MTPLTQFTMRKLIFMSMENSRRGKKAYVYNVKKKVRYFRTVFGTYSTMQ